MPRKHLLIVKAQPGLAVGATVRIVVAAVRAAAVHQHAVQLVLVLLGRVAVLRQVFAVAHIKVQHLLKLIPVVDLCTAQLCAQYAKSNSGCSGGRLGVLIWSLRALQQWLHTP